VDRAGGREGYACNEMSNMAAVSPVLKAEKGKETGKIAIAAALL
jgi:hypothetical protein